MSKAGEIIRRNALISNIGKPAVNSLFPNDFEYYLIAFELVNSQGDLIDHLIFPIMPDSIKERQADNTTIRKTAGGITSLQDPTFNVKQITLEGTFGRSFKVMVGRTPLTFNGLRFSRQSGVYKKEDLPGTPGVKLKNQIFNTKIKTGYGVTKVLESILDKSTGLDHLGRPMKLYFYNPTFGNSYLVKKNEANFSQSSPDSNMIWRYNIALTAVAPLSLISPQFKAGMIKILAAEKVNKVGQKALGSVKSSLVRKVF